MSKKTILAVAAHPDDIEFECIIQLRRLIEEGYEVYYLVATNGENGWKAPDTNKEERIKIRKEEQLSAANMIGVKEIIFWDYKDGFLEYTKELRGRLVKIIREIKPTAIFSFDPANTLFDNINLFHRDHRTIAIALFDAVFAAKNHYMYPELPEPHRIDTLYFFGSHAPNYFLDITNDIDFKMSVIRCFKSQFPDFEKFSIYYKENFTKYSPDYAFSEAFRILEINRIT